ncbi:hypothetical protein AU468_09945 [Alkalispirochaeta sphaeroplastigenens]|uniref:Lipoyl-binding domain-containing protein n=2 Tax=Alkalispirochaeta sphaeroplastigenens TaxID=1187066 RepID=A0A2S4JK49_9SPIO|nr:hypothetical protein AU468_09945 [Alkalispirochaeta sphaeroplastigenens]
MKREIVVKVNGEEVTVQASREGSSIRVEQGQESYLIEVVSEQVLGAQVVPPVASAPAGGGRAAPRAAAPAAGAAPTPGGAGAVPSPMTGVIDKVVVSEGAVVNEGDPVVVLEAMKMYIDVTAPSSGTVTGISVKSGDSVKEGQALLTIG